MHNTHNPQILTFDRVNTLSFNPFDITKSWREDEFPFIPIGEFILNRNQANFYAEIEQAAFDPANLVPGISPNTPDIMLAARLFSYKDSQRYRSALSSIFLLFYLAIDKLKYHLEPVINFFKLYYID